MSSLPSPNQSNRPPVWFLLLLGLGGPIAAGLTIAQTITQHIWQAIGIALLYAVIVLAGGILTNVWQQLESNWVKQIVDWINTGSKGYQKRYCQWLIAQHSQFDVGGLRTYDTPLPTIDQIFVELNLVRKPAFQISSATFKALEVSGASQYPISYYIEQAHLVLLGLPGSGKTTLLKNLGLTLVERKKQRKAAKIPYELPFFLSLRDYAKIIKEQEQFSLVNAVETPLQQWKRSAPPGWVEGRLKKGHCLVLLDGLDEVPDEETRLAMVKWVQQQMITYGHNNRFILTSRPYGYLDNPLNGVLVLEVQGFTNQQIRKFVHKWYEAEEANRSKHTFGLSERAKIEAEGFLRRLHSMPTLFDLTRNPLLLTMSIMVHRYRGALPGSRGELYKEICDVLLGGRQRAKGLRLALSPEQNQLVLQPLAFYMMEKQQAELTSAEAESVIEETLKTVSTELRPQAFLKIIEDSNFWVKQGHDVYGFAHLSFQEYLAAINVKEKKLIRVLVDKIRSSWWRETIILYCNRADASPIIKACLTGSPFSVPILQLAMECEEAASLSSSIDDLSVRVLFKSVLIQGSEDANPEIRQIVTEAQLAQRIEKMIFLDSEVYTTTTLINASEYQLFLDEQQKQGKDFQPDHRKWTNERFTPGQGQVPILGVRPSDALAFCDWLTERDQENWHYRLPYTSEQKKVEESLDEVGGKGIAGIGCWINEGKDFFWVKGNPIISIKFIQETIEQSYAKDLQQALTYSPSLESKGQLDLAKSLSCAHDLVETCSLTNQLLVTLRTVHDRILVQERSLVVKLKNASEKVDQLENELKQVKSQEQTLANRLSGKEREISKLENTIRDLRSQEVDIRNDLKSASKPTHKVKFNPRGLPKSEQRVQSNPQNMPIDKVTLELKLKNITNEFSTLSTELEKAHNEEVSRRQTLETFRSRRNDQQLKTKLESARKNRETLQTEFDNFHNHTYAFSRVCDRLLAITSLFNRDAVLSGVLEKNRALNLDRVLVDINDSTLNATIALISQRASAFVQELILVYDSNRTIIDAYTDDFTERDKAVLKLKHILNMVPLSESAQRLVNTLYSYLGVLSKSRPLGRSTPATILMRFTVRYLAKELVNYLSNLSWKELFSNEEQESLIDQHVLDTLMNMHITFAMLEERSEGRLPLCEGILIMKEHPEE